MKKNIFNIIILIYVSLFIFNLNVKATVVEGTGGVSSLSSNTSSSCSSSLKTAKCTYNFEMKDKSTIDLVINYSTSSNGSGTELKVDDIILSANYYTTTYKFSIVNTNVSDFFNMNTTEKTCPSTVFLNMTESSGGRSGSALKYDIELKESDLVKNSQGIVNKETAKLKTSSVTCASEDENPITSNKTVSKSYKYTCGNSQYTIVSYTDETWGVVQNTGLNFSENLIVDTSGFQKTCSACENADDIYLVTDSFTGSSSFYEYSIVSPVAAGLKSTTCKYVAEGDIPGENEKTTDTSTDTGTAVTTCEDLLGPNVLNLLKTIFKIIQIIGPIIALGLGMYDILMALANGEDDAKKKAFKKLGRRIAAAVLLLLLPYIVDFILSLIPGISGSNCLI